MRNAASIITIYSFYLKGLVIFLENIIRSPRIGGICKRIRHCLHLSILSCENSEVQFTNLCKSKTKMIHGKHKMLINPGIFQLQRLLSKY